MKKRILSFMLTALILASSLTVYAKDDTKNLIKDAVSWTKNTAGEYEGGFLSQRHLLPVGNTLSDWSAFVFAINGVDDDYGTYLNDLKFYVEDRYEEDGYLDRIKATEYHRIILTIYALGGDPTAFGTDKDGNAINLLSDGTYNFHADLGAQGLNGVIFALIATDAKDTPVPDGAKYTREYMIDTILSSREPDGGFGLAKGSSNCDITAMAVQALAKYYDREDVKSAVDGALEYLSRTMGEDGTFEMFGEKSSETIAQVIIALTALGIDPKEDERFVKGGKNILEHAMNYLCEDGGFAHSYGEDTSDFMATQQMLMALTGVKNVGSAQKSIYDFAGYDGVKINEEINALQGGNSLVLPLAGLAAGVAVIIILIVIKLRGKKNV